MIATFEPNGESTPETKAAVYAEYLRLVSLQLQPVDFTVLFHRLFEIFEAKEEQIAWEIYWAHFMLCRFHLIETNTFGRITGNTTVAPAAYLRHAVWAAAKDYPSEEDIDV